MRRLATLSVAVMSSLGLSAGAFTPPERCQLPVEDILSRSNEVYFAKFVGFESAYTGRYQIEEVCKGDQHRSDDIVVHAAAHRDQISPYESILGKSYLLFYTLESGQTKPDCFPDTYEAAPHIGKCGQTQ